MANEIKRKAQISIFVIVALLLVAVIILFFAIYREPTIKIGEEFTPESFIDKCLRKSLRETVDVMLLQGGFVSPTDYKIYNNIKVAYLCKNINFYDPCVTQYPLYITRLEQEIEINTRSAIEQCFISLEQELQDRRYEFSGGDSVLEAKLKPWIVELTVFRDLSFSKGGVSQDFDSFTTGLSNPLYDIAYVANEIASQEAKFCAFEYVGFNILYNKFDIRKYTMSDSTKIYTIKDKQTGKEMNIAIRGCAIPAGF